MPEYLLASAQTSIMLHRAVKVRVQKQTHSSWKCIRLVAYGHDDELISELTVFNRANDEIELDLMPEWHEPIHPQEGVTGTPIPEGGAAAQSADDEIPF